MRRKFTVLRVAMMVVTVGALASWAIAETLTVKTRTATVRSRPSALGKPVGKLSEGDVVNTTSSKGKWQKIKPAAAGKPSGWVHGSALQDKSVKSKGVSNAQLTANSRESVLASRGLSEEVEGRYRATKPQLEKAFKMLNRINEDPLVTDDQIRAFFAEGGIEPKEGN